MRTLVVFHAHPDDEALLTSGTMAKAAAAGHRVVLVVATDGDLGLAATSFTQERLGDVRMRELQASAVVLGVHDVIHLGYADSGSDAVCAPDAPGVQRFANAPIDEAAHKLAAILTQYDADVLMSYDVSGGYGHRDHVQVHHVGARAAEIAATPRVLEATVPRDLLVRALQLVGKVYRFPADFDPHRFETAYSARAEITHRINVRSQIKAKRASMRAHASQASADGDADRTLNAFLRIPRPLYDLVFGREWFRDPAHQGPVAHDIFAGLP